MLNLVVKAKEEKFPSNEVMVYYECPAVVLTTDCWCPSCRLLKNKKLNYVYDVEGNSEH